MKRRAIAGAVLAAAAIGTWPAPAHADAQADYDAALGLLCGQRERRDPKAAARLLERAAVQGHRGAQGLLGWMAMSGVGLPKDERLAARWLRPAAEAGDSAAQNNLGVLHALGRGVPFDLAQAERWFRAAAASGAEDAELNLKELQRPPKPRAASRPAVRQSTSRLPPALAAAGCHARTG